MAQPVIRIFSDLHYGDRASTLRSLDALTPLFDGASELVFNGDTLDTRPGPDANESAVVEEFLRRAGVPFTLLTGNHDPDFSTQHALVLAGGEVFVTHGDVLFEDIVPWSQDAALARQLVERELDALEPAERSNLFARLIAYRRAAAAIPQRHQSERHAAKYFLAYVADTVWPPTRLLRILRAWREAPQRAAELVREQRLPARFFAMGHTHRLGSIRTPNGLVVLNTGSFSAPGAAGVIDVSHDRVALRRIHRRGQEYRLADVLAEFPLAAVPRGETLRS